MATTGDDQGLRPIDPRLALIATVPTMQPTTMKIQQMTVGSVEKFIVLNSCCRYRRMNMHLVRHTMRYQVITLRSIIGIIEKAERASDHNTEQATPPFHDYPFSTTVTIQPYVRIMLFGIPRGLCCVSIGHVRRIGQ